jgi:hypothetical protein
MQSIQYYIPYLLQYKMVMFILMIVSIPVVKFKKCMLNMQHIHFRNPENLSTNLFSTFMTTVSKNMSPHRKT